MYHLQVLKSKRNTTSHQLNFRESKTLLILLIQFQPYSRLQMKRSSFLLLVLLAIGNPILAQKKGSPKADPLKQSVQQSIDAQFADMTELSDKIWSFEEIAFQETQSSAALSAYAEKLGFKVTRGVGEIPTAFVAEYGSGAPIIGIMGEFDGLPGLSQNKVPFLQVSCQRFCDE